MAVRIDDPWGYEHAVEVQYGSAVRLCNLRRRSQLTNAAVLQYQGDVFLRACAGTIDDGRTRENGHLCSGLGSEQQKHRCQNCKNAYPPSRNPRLSGHNFTWSRTIVWLYQLRVIRSRRPKLHLPDALLQPI